MQGPNLIVTNVCWQSDSESLLLPVSLALSHFLFIMPYMLIQTSIKAYDEFR